VKTLKAIRIHEGDQASQDQGHQKEGLDLGLQSDLPDENLPSLDPHRLPRLVLLRSPLVNLPQDLVLNHHQEAVDKTLEVAMEVVT